MASGDHIFVRRPLGYTHHGIDCGDGTVIHFTGEPGQDKTSAKIARSDWASFAQGGEVRVRRYGKRDDADTTIRRAESKLGSADYHLVVNNCEHFATWCCTGREASEQVRGVGGLTAQGALAGSTVAATGGVLAGLGITQGVSAAGVMSALGSAGGAVGGAASGPAVLGLAPAMVSVGITHVALRDDESLPDEERAARRDGRYASVAGAGLATVGGVGAISAAGSVAGLSAAGITSGLATIGGVVGGGMVAGAGVVIVAPAVAAAAAGFGIYRLARWLRSGDPTPPRRNA